MVVGERVVEKGSLGEEKGGAKVKKGVRGRGGGGEEEEVAAGGLEAHPPEVKDEGAGRVAGETGSGVGQGARWGGVWSGRCCVDKVGDGFEGSV